MRPIPGAHDDPDPPQLQTRVAKKPAVRGGHVAFLGQASGAIASSVAESTQLLREVGASTNKRDAFGKAASQGRGYAKAPQPPRSISPAPNSAASGDRRRVQIQSGTPHDPTRSARELFEALAASGTGALPPPAIRGQGEPADEVRTVNVFDYQRGKRLVAPAAPLPFPGPDGRSPGDRRRAAAVGANPTTPASIGDKSRGANGPSDGHSSMLVGVRVELGEILTAPVADCSTFDHLLDRLVDTPEACFADPLALVHGRGPLGGGLQGPGKKAGPGVGEALAWSFDA